MVTKTKTLAPPDFTSMRMRLPDDETTSAGYICKRIELEGTAPNPVRLTHGIKACVRLLNNSTDLARREVDQLQANSLHDLKRQAREGFRGRVTMETTMREGEMIERISSISLHGIVFTFTLSLGTETDRQPSRFFTVSWDAEKASIQLVRKLFELLGMKEQHFAGLHPSDLMGGRWLEVSNEDGSFTLFLKPRPGVEQFVGA